MAAQPETNLTEDQQDAEDAAVERALREAVREAIIQHKRAGNSIVVWRDGEIIEIPASDINVDE